MSVNRISPLWLQIASITDEVFGRGIAWNVAPHIFANLELIGLVERVPSSTGQSERAVITDQGAAALNRMREQARLRNARRAGEVAHG